MDFDYYKDTKLTFTIQQIWNISGAYQLKCYHGNVKKKKSNPVNIYRLIKNQ